MKIEAAYFDELPGFIRYIRQSKQAIDTFFRFAGQPLIRYGIKYTILIYFPSSLFCNGTQLNSMIPAAGKV